LVTADCVPSIDGLAAVTVTPGSTAPLLSATRPVIVAVELAPPPCANAADVASESTPSASTARWNHFMTHPPDKKTPSKTNRKTTGKRARDAGRDESATGYELPGEYP
jgi:hypothetical protein